MAHRSERSFFRVEGPLVGLSDMEQKKIIAVIAGGDSSEDVISYRSGAQVYGCLDRAVYEPYLVVLRRGVWRVNPVDATPEGATLPVDLNDFSFCLPAGGGSKKKFDYALIEIHGTPGENGILQGNFELMGIPYSTCSAEVSALTFNKALCKAVLRGQPGINLAREILLHRGEPMPEAEAIVRELGLPFFVKPNASGSSFGVTKIKSADPEVIQAAIQAAFAESDAVLLEQFVDGREVSCGIMVAGGREWILPVTELITENEFFDFEAKYTAGACREVTPADLPEDIVRRLNTATATAYRTLGCRGVVRVDFIVDRRTGQPYFIEVNTTPGMSAASIVPQQWREAGLTMGEAFGLLIEETSKKSTKNN